VTRQALIVGGGIGGLAAAIACTRAGWGARLYEQAPEFSEVGAGIQLGPNATRILAGWGLQDALSRVSAFPQQLLARSALDGRMLGCLGLGNAFNRRYGAPYVTVHRADLQGLLVQAAQSAGVAFSLSSRATAVSSSPAGLRLLINDETEVEADALVAADGLWSRLREQVVGGGPPAWTGHVAYRALALQSALPPVLRSQDVTVWLGPRLHIVAYPVKAGEQLNVVAIVQGRRRGAAGDWDQAGAATDLQEAMGPLCGSLQDLVRAMPAWRLWELHDRPPLRSADEMARGRVALLGDAAHPMRPYLAQGAGMAIEDAAQLGAVLSQAGPAALAVQTALRRYALNRWQRCAKVQARAQRNGRIFHATGLVEWGRNLSMRLLGEQLLDQPWLYGA
jgi:salicylate hydroxylase